MESIIVWIVLRFFTEIVKIVSEKTWKKVSMRLVVCVLCLIGGAVYYAFNTAHPEIVEKIAVFIGGSFATSQAMWMFMDKILPKTS